MGHAKLEARCILQSLPLGHAGSANPARFVARAILRCASVGASPAPNRAPGGLGQSWYRRATHMVDGNTPGIAPATADDPGDLSLVCPRRASLLRRADTMRAIDR